MAIEIENQTAWRTEDLRAIVRRCEEWLGLNGEVNRWCRTVHVNYSNRQQTTGYAYLHGGSMTLHLPSPFPRRAQQRPHPVIQWSPDGTAQVVQSTGPGPRVNEIGEMRPDLFADLCWTVEHELLHVLGWTHNRMRREKHPAYAPGRHALPPKWADTNPPLRLRVKAAEMPRPKLTPEQKAERRARLIADRAETREGKLRDSLVRWQRKLKLAQGKVVKLKAKIRAIDRRKAAKLTPRTEGP